MATFSSLPTAFLGLPGPPSLLRPLPPLLAPAIITHPHPIHRAAASSSLTPLHAVIGARGLEQLFTTIATTSSHGGTWACLVGSAALGLALERRTPAGRALGASLLAFLLQAAAANAGLAPADSPAYDACWGSVLPASLSVSVLLAVDAAGAAAGGGAGGGGGGGLRWRGRGWMASSLGKVSIAYVWGALGSLAGAVLAFHATAAAFPGGLARPVLARVAAAVAATYVGGSVNFFQVARAVGLGEGEGGQGLMGAVAGADIFLMACYFAALVRGGGGWMDADGVDDRLSVTAWLIMGHHKCTTQIGMQRSQPRGMAAFLHPNSAGTGSHSSSTHNSRRRTPDPIVDMPASSTSTSASITRSPPSWAAKPLQHLAAFTLAAALGQAGQAAERRAGVPGAAAAATTALSLAAYGLCRRLSPRAFRALAARAPALSAFLFALFFAAIGAGASLSHLLLSGPAVFLLMGLALLAHLGTTAVALRLHNAAVARSGSGGDDARGDACVGVDEMVIASNANIGGPATAAAMAASIGRPDLVLAATATGTLGYSLATWLGVAVYRWLVRGGGG